MAAAAAVQLLRAAKPMVLSEPSLEALCCCSVTITYLIQAERVNWQHQWAALSQMVIRAVSHNTGYNPHCTVNGCNDLADTHTSCTQHGTGSYRSPLIKTTLAPRVGPHKLQAGRTAAAFVILPTTFMGNSSRTALLVLPACATVTGPGCVCDEG